MTERLQEILNRKPSKWGNLTVKEFERDIKLLQERVQDLEELIAAYHTELSIKDNANKRIKKKNKRYREALEKIARINIEQGTVATTSEVYAVLTARKALEGEE